MVPDISAFVAACTVCAQNKTPQQAPSGLLQPLPVHIVPGLISLDFVTGLPLSNGNTVILTVVDRFSKAAHFIPLPKLPSAKETAQLMVQHVFRIHGLPVDMVSDRGPPFSSQFWKVFCTLVYEAFIPCLMTKRKRFVTASLIYESASMDVKT
jgi:hypothetical protein